MSRLERIETHTDALTGEVLSQGRKVIELTKLEPEPDYVKMYVADLSKLVGLKEGHGRILPFIAASVGYDGFISLAGGRKGDCIDGWMFGEKCK